MNAAHRTKFAARALVNQRSVQARLPGPRRDQQVSVRVHLERTGAVDLHLYSLGIAAGLDFEVVLQTIAAPVEVHVHARVYIADAEAPVLRHVSAPSAGVGSDEVMALARQGIDAFE